MREKDIKLRQTINRNREETEACPASEGKKVESGDGGRQSACQKPRWQGEKVGV